MFHVTNVLAESFCHSIDNIVDYYLHVELPYDLSTYTNYGFQNHSHGTRTICWRCKFHELFFDVVVDFFCRWLSARGPVFRALWNNFFKFLTRTQRCILSSFSRIKSRLNSQSVFLRHGRGSVVCRSTQTETSFLLNFPIDLKRYIQTIGSCAVSFIILEYGKKIDLQKCIHTNFVHLLKSSHLVKPHEHVILSNCLLRNFVLCSTCIGANYLCQLTDGKSCDPYFKCRGEAIQKAVFIFSVSDIKESWRMGESFWHS